jgi:hypothetical protein
MGREDASSRNAAALAGRIPRHLQPSVPAWDQAGPPLPWWETVSPTPSARRIQLETADELIIPSISSAGETGTGERGWAPMKRILIALAGLAALFLAAGANAKI